MLEKTRDADVEGCACALFTRPVVRQVSKASDSHSPVADLSGVYENQRSFRGDLYARQYPVVLGAVRFGMKVAGNNGGGSLECLRSTSGVLNY